MATHSSILAWRIPGPEESGESMGKNQTQLSDSTTATTSCIYISCMCMYIPVCVSLSSLAHPPPPCWHSPLKSCAPAAASTRNIQSPSGLLSSLPSGLSQKSHLRKFDILPQCFECSSSSSYNYHDRPSTCLCSASLAKMSAPWRQQLPFVTEISSPRTVLDDRRHPNMCSIN